MTMRLAAPLLVAALALGSCGKGGNGPAPEIALHPGCQKVAFETTPLTLCVADPALHTIRTALGPANGKPWRSLANLSANRPADAQPVVFALNAGMFGLEVVQGQLAGSMALQADALDFAGDAATYGLSLFALTQGLAFRSKAALVKGVSLGLMGVYVLAASLWRTFVDGAPFIGQTLISKDKAYLFDAANLRAILWDPEAMELKGESIDFADLLKEVVEDAPGYTPQIFTSPGFVKQVGDGRHRRHHLRPVAHDHRDPVSAPHAARHEPRRRRTRLALEVGVGPPHGDATAQRVVEHQCFAGAVQCAHLGEEPAERHRVGVEDGARRWSLPRGHRADVRVASRTGPPRGRRRPWPRTKRPTRSTRPTSISTWAYRSSRAS